MNVTAVNSVSVYSGNKPPSFNGYYEVVSNGAKSSIDNLKFAENLFGNLVSEIEWDPQIIKTQFFSVMKKLFLKRGLKGMFNVLAQTADSNLVIHDTMQKVRKDNIVSVASTKNGHLLDITSYSSKPYDVHLGFSSGKKGYIEFYTNKKGEIFVERTYGDEYVNTGFYSDTGTKKVEIESFAGGSPEKTFYNRDGSKPFFKNWLWGGPAVEPIY